MTSTPDLEGSCFLMRRTEGVPRVVEFLSGVSSQLEPKQRRRRGMQPPGAHVDCLTCA
jgi:hypothetical protein